VVLVVLVGHRALLVHLSQGLAVVAEVVESHTTVQAAAQVVVVLVVQLVLMVRVAQ
jgi:hypothetical protein